MGHNALGLFKGSREYDSSKYELKFDIQPYPELGKEIKPTDYRLQLVSAKK